MSHVFPVDLVSTGLVERLRSVRNTFSPPLKVVEVDQYWHVGVDPTKLQSRLPAVLIEFVDSSQSVDNFTVMSVWNFKAHYLTPASPSGRAELQVAQRLLLEAITQGEQFDEISELADSIGLNSFLSCVPTSTRSNEQLMPANIGWLEVDVAVRTKSN